MPAKKSARPVRVNRIAKALCQRHKKREAKKGAFNFKKPLRRRERNPRLKRMIAYDLETTAIQKGTPKPLYLTSFGEDFKLSMRLRSLEHLLEIVTTRLLLPEYRGCRFVAWNGNNFDVFFIAAALLHSPDYILRPYLTRSKNLRGIKVISKADSKLYWEFLDGMAMTGIIKKLSEFLKVFAPDYQKLTAPDWENENFNPLNPRHVEYAERDSEGLYHALQNAQAITLKNFNMGLQPTIGNMGIKIFQGTMPQDVEVWGAPFNVDALIRNIVMRGGYCHDQKKYFGKIWKYDINQAYAAAMRDAHLPAGRCIHSKSYNRYAACAVYRCRASHSKNQIPFYYKKMSGEAAFGVGTIDETWLTSLEVDQLKKEKWQIEILESYFWDGSFCMREYVNKLEDLRVNAPGGTKSAQGEMMKAIGNNSYGKTVEELDGLELQLALERPEGFYEYQAEDDLLQHVWFKLSKPLMREYHQPQLGAFITAYVRMEVRRAALLDAAHWLYADTDCVIYSRPQLQLNVHPTRYGAWKREVEGEVYYIIDKKVYAQATRKIVDGKEVQEKHAKGMNKDKLSVEQYAAWYAGSPPTQTQVHRQNFIKVMTGGEMFTECEKVGSKMQDKAQEKLA